MTCSPEICLHDHASAEYGHAEGFHVSSVLNGAAPETYRRDYGVPQYGHAQG